MWLHGDARWVLPVGGILVLLWWSWTMWRQSAVRPRQWLGKYTALILPLWALAAAANVRKRST